MRKVELLAPAGSMEAFDAALANGADAIYLAGNMYGARAYAKNFSLIEMQEAIKKAHLYDVKVYVTINTLIKEEEVNDVIEYIKQLQAIDVDALIVADVGLFALIHQHFPNLELHASTQMHIHNQAGIEFIKNLGAKRVVLPRETNIETIKQLTKLDMEIEVFVHGAICVSYSGQCLFSALHYGRSGNRGECAQPCRMKYQLKQDNNIIPLDSEYLISPKDLFTLDHIPKLIEAGVTSFKIEGRMKRAEYVALMSKYYRQAIDAYYQHTSFEITQEMIEEMQKIYHRGFTHGLMYQEYNEKFLHGKRPNHMGIEVGRVTRVSKNQIYIKLIRELNQGDGIRFINDEKDEGFRLNRLYKNGLLVNKGNPCDEVSIDKSFNVKKGDLLVKTSDCKQLAKLQKSYEGYLRKILLKAKLIMEANQKAILIVDDGNNQIKVETNALCDKAQKDLSERYLQQLAKSKDTPYQFQKIEIDMPQLAFIPIKEINELRRKALLLMNEVRMKAKHEPKYLDYQRKHMNIPLTNHIMIIIENEEQYLACKQLNFKMIYTSNSYLKQKHPDLLFKAPRVVNKYQGEDMISEWGGVRDSIVSDPYMNVTHSETSALLFEKGVSTVCLSLELKLEEIKQLYNSFKNKYGCNPNFAIMIYGREELMIQEYCVIQRFMKNNNQKHCGLCHKHHYELVDQKNISYPLLSDESCRIHMLNNEARDDIDMIDTYQQIGITNYLISFTIESKAEVIKVLNRVLKYA